MDKKNITSEKKPRLLLAILTAIGMGLIGCLLWGLLYYFGYIAWIGAFVIVVGAAWGYTKFNLKMDKKGYFIIALIAIVEAFITMFITLNIYCMVLLEGQANFFETFGVMFEVIGSFPEVKQGLISDSILSLVFILVGLLSFFFSQRSIEKRERQAQINKEKMLNEKQIIDSESAEENNTEKTEDKEDK